MVIQCEIALFSLVHSFPLSAAAAAVVVSSRVEGRGTGSSSAEIR